MYVQSPLCPGFPWKQCQGLERWIELKYERLINFCFTYQQIGHENKSCETQAQQERTSVRYGCEEKTS